MTCIIGQDIENAEKTGRTYVISGTQDPTLQATAAFKGTLFVKLSSPVGLYQKQDDGCNTNWTLLGSGGGGGGSATFDYPADPGLVAADIGKLLTSDGGVASVYQSSLGAFASGTFAFLANPAPGDQIGFFIPGFPIFTFTFTTMPMSPFDVPIGMNAAETAQNFEIALMGAPMLSPSDLWGVLDVPGGTNVIMTAGSNFPGTAGNNIVLGTSAPLTIQLQGTNPSGAMALNGNLTGGAVPQTYLGKLIDLVGGTAKVSGLLIDSFIAQGGIAKGQSVSGGTNGRIKAQGPSDMFYGQAMNTVADGGTVIVIRTNFTG